MRVDGVAWRATSGRQYLHGEVDPHLLQCGRLRGQVRSDGMSGSRLELERCQVVLGRTTQFWWGRHGDLELLELIDGRSYTYNVDQPAVHGRLQSVWATVY